MEDKEDAEAKEGIKKSSMGLARGRRGRDLRSMGGRREVGAKSGGEQGEEPKVESRCPTKERSLPSLWPKRRSKLGRRLGSRKWRRDISSYGANGVATKRKRQEIKTDVDGQKRRPTVRLDRKAKRHRDIEDWRAARYSQSER